MRSTLCIYDLAFGELNCDVGRGHNRVLKYPLSTRQRLLCSENFVAEDGCLTSRKTELWPWQALRYSRLHEIGTTIARNTE